MKRIILILLSIFILTSCSRQGGKPAQSSPEGAGGTQGEQAVGNAAPVVVSGAILPARPVSGTSLVVQYMGGDKEGDPIKYNFRWYVDNDLVQEGSSNVLEPGSYKKGASIHVEIIPSDSFSSGKPFKTDAITILNQPPSVSAISLDPLPAFIGTVVTASVDASDPDGDEIAYTYQWKVNGRAVTEPQNSNTFNTHGLRKRDVISAVVTPSDGEAAGTPVESGGITLSNSAPQITSNPPSELEGSVYVYQVAARDPDGDKLSYSLAASPPGMTINRSTGLIRWEPPKQLSGREEVTVKLSVDDGDGGVVFQEVSLTLEMK